MSARRRSANRYTARATILAVLIGALLVAAVFPARTYLSERSQIAELTRQAKVLQQGNGRLDHKIRQLHDQHYLEQLARECLGMVKPGEVSFVIVPRGAGSDPASC